MSGCTSFAELYASARRHPGFWWELVRLEFGEARYGNWHPLIHVPRDLAGFVWAVVRPWRWPR